MGKRPREERIAIRTGVVIVLIAVLIRVAYLAQYSALPDWFMLTVDNWYHHHWAQAVAGGDLAGGTTYFRAPFYVWCLGLLYAVAGSGLWVARVFGVVVGLLSIGATYLITNKLFDRKTAAVAALFQSVYPLIIYFEAELLLDPLFMLLLQVVVYRYLIWQESRTPRAMFCLGLAIGLATITRPTALIVVPLVLFMLVTFRRQSNHLALRKQIIMLLVGLAVFVGPVFVRNLVVAGDPVLIASQGGINFYLGNNDDADGLSAVLPEPLGHNWEISQITHIAETAVGHDLKPGGVSSYWAGEALRWIADHPGRFLALIAKKLYYQISNAEISNNRELAPFFAEIGLFAYLPISFAPLFGLALVGMLVHWRSNRGVSFVVLLIVFYILAVLPFFYSSRFRLPLLPLYMTLGAAGAGHIFRRLAHRRRSVAAWLLVAIGAGLLTVLPLYPISENRSVQDIVTRGTHHLARGEFGAARYYFQIARERDPSFPEVNLHLGVTFLRQQYADSAEFYFQEEIARHPDRPRAYHNLASLRLVSGQPSEAIRVIENGLALAPWDITANRILIRGAATDSSLSPDEALTFIDRAVDNSDADIQVLLEAGTASLELGDSVRGQRYLEAAREASPPPIETDDRAFTPIYDEIVRDLHRARASASYQLGYLHGRQGDFERAIAFSRESIERDSTLSEAYVNLVSGYLSVGQRRQADSVLSLGLARFPDNNYLQRLRQSLIP